MVTSRVDWKYEGEKEGKGVARKNRPDSRSE
jgi:hypothetical protein